MNHNKKHKQGKQKPAKPVLEPLSADLGDGDSKFSRALGSTDYLTREQGLTALSRWLTTRTDVSDLEMLRLWKGLYFCFWHSDKVPVQVQPRLSHPPAAAAAAEASLPPPAAHTTHACCPWAWALESYHILKVILIPLFAAEVCVCPLGTRTNGPSSPHAAACSIP
jgi:hypothetical protein